MDSTQTEEERQTEDFSSVIQSWRDLSLPSLLLSLRPISTSLLSSQKTSLQARKALADQTREFKKQPASDQLESFKPLLKSYQAEIDSLTKRSKASENAFFDVLEKLEGVRDPLRALEVVLDQAASLSELSTLRTSQSNLLSTNQTLKSTNQSLNSEIQTLKSQLSAKNSSLDSEISSKYEARIKNSKDRELSLEGLLADKEEILKDLRERNESLTQKLVGQQDGEATLGGNSENEREWNIEEIIKLKNRNLDLEVQIHGFKERLEGSLDSKLLEKERESWRVKEEEFKIEKQGLEDLVEEKQKSWEEEKSKLEEELKKEKKVGKEGESERKRLKTLLEERKDWEEVKRENLVMRMVEFNIEDEDEKLEEKEKMEKEVKPLEVLLIEKNRKLEKEVTDLRVSNSTHQTSNISTSSELESLRSEVQKLRTLNEKLEDDLINIDSSNTNSKKEDGVKGFDIDGTGNEIPKSLSTSNPKTETEMSAEEALAELESLSSNPLRKSKPSSNSTSTSNPSSTKNPNSTPSSSSLLPILTSQRDRFRLRNSELEEELRKQSSIIRDLRDEIKRLGTDNLSLYEKVRYLSSYREEISNPMSAGVDGFRSIKVENGIRAREYPPSKSPSGAGGGGGVEDGYRERYEQSMNPFEAFRGREQNRVLSTLNPLERILHMLTRLVLGHRRMRLLFMVYAVVLHLLVFGMLMETGWSSASAHERLTPVAAPNPLGGLDAVKSPG